MPDALSKTVPLWCAVINLAIKLNHSKKGNWDTALYTPPGAVSVQEHVQIERRIEEWAKQLHVSICS
jgi:tRNA A64-2'-O-ribosylphosphate transferase